MSVCLSVSVPLSIYLSIYLPISLHLSVSLSSIYLSLHLSIQLSFYPTNLPIYLLSTSTPTISHSLPPYTYPLTSMTVSQTAHPPHTEVQRRSLRAVLTLHTRSFSPCTHGRASPSRAAGHQCSSLLKPECV